MQRPSCHGLPCGPWSKEAGEAGQEGVVMKPVMGARDLTPIHLGAKAKAAGKYQGRPADADQRVRELLMAGLGIRAMARHADCLDYDCAKDQRTNATVNEPQTEVKSWILTRSCMVRAAMSFTTPT